MQVVLRPFHWRSTHPCKSPLYSNQLNITVFLHIQGGTWPWEGPPGEKLNVGPNPTDQKSFSKKRGNDWITSRATNQIFLQNTPRGRFKITTLKSWKCAIMKIHQTSGGRIISLRNARGKTLKENVRMVMVVWSWNFGGIPCFESQVMNILNMWRGCTSTSSCAHCKAYPFKSANNFPFLKPVFYSIY